MKNRNRYLTDMERFALGVLLLIFIAGIIGGYIRG